MKEQKRFKTIYYRIVYSHLLYGILLWGSECKTTMQSLKSFKIKVAILPLGIF